MGKKFDKLTTKRKHFVEKVFDGKTGRQAVIESYPNAKDSSAKEMAYNLMQQESVKGALREKFEERYSTVDDDIVAKLRDALTNPEVKMSDSLKAIDLIAKIKGSYAPTRSANLKADMKDWLKLPKDKK